MTKFTVLVVGATGSIGRHAVDWTASCSLMAPTAAQPRRNALTTALCETFSMCSALVRRGLR